MYFAALKTWKATNNLKLCIAQHAPTISQIQSFALTVSNHLNTHTRKGKIKEHNLDGAPDPSSLKPGFNPSQTAFCRVSAKTPE